MEHQYIDRATGAVRTEKLLGDGTIRFIYSALRENSPIMFKAVTSRWVSGALGFLNYDGIIGIRFGENSRFLKECGIDLSECLDAPGTLDTPRKVFERKIRYWQCRPMPDDPGAVVCPSDSRVIAGSLLDSRMLPVKNKFFEFDELIGAGKGQWKDKFAGGMFAVFRLTPDKYHYNHCPVDGMVVDFYETDGAYHSCNPAAIACNVLPYSKNRRTVTIIDTDVEGGTGVGHVAMIEVVALMIGRINHCYSERGYDDPLPVKVGMRLKKGRPKSLFMPGSSTVVLLFESGRIQFADDILRNINDGRAASRYSAGLGRGMVETDVRVRSLLANRKWEG